MGTMIVSLLFVLLGSKALAAPLDEDRDDSCFEFDIHHVGFGLNKAGGNNNHGATGSAEGCQTLCQKTDGCAWFNWVGVRDECWLKTQKGTKTTKKPGGVSGPRECETGEGEDDMILSPEQKLMLAQSEIKNAKDQVAADNYNEDKKPAKVFYSSRAITTPTWTKGILYYDLSTLGFHMWWLKPTIRSALKELQEKTDNCVQFVEQKSDHGHVEVHSTLTGCDSHVGYKGYFKGENQRLSLGYGCLNKGVIQHEFIHALGFYHTQGRSDRDRFIEIKVKNIIPRQKHNFKKYDPSMIKHYGLPFDYESIMMYPTYAFTKNGKKTIVTTDSTKQNLIGQRKGPSAGDIKMIKKAYEHWGNKKCKT